MSFKVVFAGSSGVGKTSIAYHMQYGEIPKGQYSTIGSNFETLKVKIEDKEYSIKLWDTAGQEQYHSITKTYFNGANAILLVFALNNQSSFDTLETWIQLIHEAAPPNIPIILLGNKSDTDDHIENEDKQIFDFKNKHPDVTVYLATSAADGTNINEALYSCIEEILKDPQELMNTPTERKIQPGQGTGSCC